MLGDGWQVVKREQTFVVDLFRLSPDDLDEDNQRLEVLDGLFLYISQTQTAGTAHDHK